MGNLMGKKLQQKKLFDYLVHSHVPNNNSKLIHNRKKFIIGLRQQKLP